MNPLFQTDSYKLSHRGFMVPGTEHIYSNGTPRNFHYLPVNKEDFDNKVIFFGLQRVLKKLDKQFHKKFFKLKKDKAIGQLRRLFDAYLGQNAVPMEHFEELHDLGYLPIRVKALPEGVRVGPKVPVFTIVNTDPRFAWLTNYLETVISCELWKPMTVATIIAEYRKLVNDFARKTTGSIAGTEFQIHDFSYRGMSNTEDAATSGSAFLLSSCGTDNIPALHAVEKYYNGDVTKEFIGTSVPASEHSLASAGIAVDGELETIRRWITQDYPTGIVSVISDTTDFFRVVTEYAKALHDNIVNRKPNELGLAKVVFRPDSGNPVHIVAGYRILELDDEAIEDVWNAGYEVVRTCGNVFFKLETYQSGGELAVRLGKKITEAEAIGAVECLAREFGTTQSATGYKLLHERVGLIYGDSITLERAKEIFVRLEEKGYASTNIVFGVGSFTCQYLTRDSIGFAVKATASVVDGKLFELSKDPITDDGTKKSAKGLLRVELENGEYVLYDQQTYDQERTGELTTVYENGFMWDCHTFQEVRDRVAARFS